jgi:hypothetical protein
LRRHSALMRMCSPPPSMSTDTATTTPNCHYVLKTYGTRKNSFLLFQDRIILAELLASNHF